MAFTPVALSVPFASNPEAARQRINQDVATHTGDRLKELLPRDPSIPSRVPCS